MHRPGEALRTAGPVLATSVALILLAAAIRWFTSGYSLWIDDYYSVLFARQPVDRLWSAWMVRETNPPLYYTALGAWTAIAGESRVALRLFSILTGLASIAVLTLYARRFFGARAAGAVALFAAVSATHVFYSQQVRGYMLAYLAVAVSLYGLTLLFVGERAARRRGALLYALGALAAIHCHTVFVLWPIVATIAFAGARLLLDRRIDLSGIALVLALDVAVAAGSGWWLWITYQQLQGPEGWIAPLTLTRYRWLLANGMASMIAGDAWPGAIKYVVLVAVSAAIVALRRDRVAVLLTALLASGIIVFGVAGAIKPIILDRTIFWLSMVPLILLAAGVARIGDARKRLAAMAGLAALLLANTLTMAPHFAMQDWAGPLRRVAADRKAVLLSTGQSAIIVRIACEIEVDPCRTPVLALAGDDNDPILAGLPGARQHSLADLRHALPRDTHLYLARETESSSPRLFGITSQFEIVGPVPLSGQPPR